jgi:hypothetical protein
MPFASRLSGASHAPSRARRARRRRLIRRATATVAALACLGSVHMCHASINHADALTQWRQAETSLESQVDAGRREIIAGSPCAGDIQAQLDDLYTAYPSPTGDSSTFSILSATARATSFAHSIAETVHACDTHQPHSTT